MCCVNKTMGVFLFSFSYIFNVFSSRREEEAAHQEAVERVHALHEGDAGQSGSRMHAQRERRHQPNPRSTGKLLASNYDSKANGLLYKYLVSLWKGFLPLPKEEGRGVVL